MDTPRRQRLRWDRTGWEGRQGSSSGPFLLERPGNGADEPKLYGPGGEVLLPVREDPLPFGFAPGHD